MVHHVISPYNRFGVAAVETPGKGHRRHHSLTLEEEQADLSPFISCAEKGEMATVDAIRNRLARERSPAVTAARSGQRRA